MATKTSEVIRLNNVRLSFPKLFTPVAFEVGGTKKFEATFLLDTSDAKHAAKIKEVKSAAAALMKESYGADFKASALKGLCFGSGDSKTKADGSVVDGYEGMFYLVAKNTVRPAVANRKGEPVAEGDEQTPYGGCYVNATVTLWAQNNKWGKRINANLRGVQFVADGEAFGTAPMSADSEFEALEDGGASDAFDDFADDEDPFA